MTDINPRARHSRSIAAPCASSAPGSAATTGRRLEEHAGYPEAFVHALTEAGWLAALIPEEYGGGGLGVTEASVILEEINRSGANSGACHAQMYIMGALLRHGSEAQKQRYLPDIAAGGAAPAVVRRDRADDRHRHDEDHERSPSAAATATSSTDRRCGSRAMQHSDLMLLLARTTPLAEVKKKTEGLSMFLVDLRGAEGRGLTVRPIRNMVNHETNEVFFEDFEVPAENLIGEEGKGFRYILDGMNAERILIAAECIGDGYWFIDRARTYANERIVFDRPIGQNQGIQFPIARAYANVRAADLMRYEAARLFDAGEPAGAEANMAKLLAADASWEAANVCLQTFGGFGFAAEYDVERKFRETRLYQVAPISTNLILSYLASTCSGCRGRFREDESWATVQRRGSGASYG